MRLYEISGTYQRLLDAIDAGEIPEEAIADTLEAVEGELTDKLDNIACIVKSISAESDAIKAEADRLTERRRAKTKHAERLIDYMYHSMKATGKTKIETARNKLTIKQNPEAVDVADETKARQFFKDTKQTKFLIERQSDLNKTEIKKALQSGEIIPGVSLTRAERLEVK